MNTTVNSKYNKDELIRIINTSLEEKKAENISIIDISEISIMMDVIVICSAGNINQLKALADNVDYNMKNKGIDYNHIEGYKGADWILMDYGDIVVNIFDRKARDFYDLDHIWSDGKAYQGLMK